MNGCSPTAVEQPHLRASHRNIRCGRMRAPPQVRMLLLLSSPSRLLTTRFQGRWLCTDTLRLLARYGRRFASKGSDAVSLCMTCRLQRGGFR